MARKTFVLVSKRDFRRLARLRKRHYTFAAAIGFIRHVPGSARIIPTQRVDLPGVFVCDQSETAMPRPAGRGEADVFAPFVYRLGRHPFTVERAVRFR